MSKRNDLHNAVNLVTENYEYLFAADLQSPWALGLSSTVEGQKFLADLHNYDPATADRGCSQCHHCGAHLRYVAWMRHLPTGYTIAVGETCLSNRFERATADFQKLRKAAELDRAKQRIVKAREAFCTENPDLAFLDDTTQETWPVAVQGNSFAGSLSHALRRYGNLTDGQLKAIRPAIDKMIARHEEKLAEAAKPETEKVPVAEGKVQITGEVKSLKWQDGDYGPTFKMLVLDDRGFKVWGTVPGNLSNHIATGDRIVFSATVTAKAGEVDFGYFKRPTKAVSLTEFEVDEWGQRVAA